ncbi:glycoside hydrolase family 15 protein [Amycolatopsis acidiphila]|uniref:Trehalase n=1 Tax=Amycolatopsis acidiphila TaxID=715473 RepID=A0A558AFE1_9PSEU|nr:glycoside hydrolase family 15 protein [Amycolatopsis acidiphila]TVT22979.1 glycoside hydrolase family 15 protein [Amycolatopsis acidiphila]UIJ57141.1 glycoside hydrolase family 15 protein [Amycolatopsis acidiphila]GHG53106.1 glucoamylase [Amycolatopsis acidiphila]
MAPLIEDYALLGDLHTAALLARDGGIDWLCLPRFDSPACFAALLHDEHAGTWRLGPAAGGPATRRRYLGDTLIMASEWDTPDGTVRVLDFMPPRGEAPDVVRIVEGVSGRVPMRMLLRLRFDYGSVIPWVRHQDGGLAAVAGPDAVWLRTPVDLHGDDKATHAEFTVEAGQRIPFVLTHHASHLPHPKAAEPDQALADTRRFWAGWSSQCRYRGPWRDAVRRALITLKALTYVPTGGILAAATTSLPEQLGGSRNWDYRYCWLRDATFTLQALLGTGYTREARAWREWLVRAVAGDPGDLQIMYGLDGSRRLPESTLDWLGGYEKSAPVRVGNAAAGQFQLDVWGEVLDGLHLAREAGLPTAEPAWDLQRGLLDFLESHWDQPDNSLWEVRGPRRHFVHSKVMAWAGLDRAVRTVENHHLDGPVGQWRALRDRIHRDVCEHGYDEDRNTFTQFYGSRGLDAALLLIPRVGFLPWHDRRVHGTVEAVRTELAHDGFVRRYDPDADGGVDGLPGHEGSFLACAFWLADALHGTGREDDAQRLFEKLLGLRNDVGLLSEEYDTERGRQVGNTPQAFSVVGLVNTARHLGGTPTVTSASREQQGLRETPAG